jgi:hypothetical protein
MYIDTPSAIKAINKATTEKTNPIKFSLFIVPTSRIIQLIGESLSFRFGFIYSAPPFPVPGVVRFAGMTEAVYLVMFFSTSVICGYSPWVFHIGSLLF